MKHLTLEDHRAVKVLRNLAIAKYQANKKVNQTRIKIIGTAQLSILKNYLCSLNIKEEEDLISESLRVDFTGDWKLFSLETMMRITDAFFIRSRFDGVDDLKDLKKNDMRHFHFTYRYPKAAEPHRLMFDMSV